MFNAYLESLIRPSKTSCRLATLALAMCPSDLWSDRSCFPQNFPMPGSKVVYLLRHGEAKHNLYDSGPGSYARRRDPMLVDPPLTEKGVSQVQASRQEMEAETRLISLMVGKICTKPWT